MPLKKNVWIMKKRNTKASKRKILPPTSKNAENDNSMLLFMNICFSLISLKNEIAHQILCTQ